MIRRKATRHDEEADLNLIPIMNLVLILIPLLLLGIVFVELAVIPVTMPEKMPMRSDASPEIPKKLQVMVSSEGFWILDSGTALPPTEDCATRDANSRVSVCLANPDAEEAVERYDWLALYNTLLTLKQDHKWHDHTQIELAAQGDVPYGVMVKAMDISRYQRATTSDASRGNHFASAAELSSSSVARDESSAPVLLFPQTVLGLPTTM